MKFNKLAISEKSLNRHVNLNINRYMGILIGRNIEVNMTMHIHRDKVMDFIKSKKIVTSREVAEMLQVSWNTADRYLTELLIEGKVDRIKKQRVTLWLKKA